MVLPLQVVIPQAFLSFPRFFSRKPLHQQIWQYHLIFATRFPISTAFPTLVYQLSHLSPDYFLGTEYFLEFWAKAAWCSSALFDGAGLAASGTQKLKSKLGT